MRVDRSIRAPDPRFFARKVACGTPICSSCWYVYRRCCPDMYAGTTTSEKITQTGKRFASWKEGGPKWGRQDHKLDGESVAQARLPIIIEIQDIHKYCNNCMQAGIVNAIVHRIVPRQPVFCFLTRPCRLDLNTV